MSTLPAVFLEYVAAGMSFDGHAGNFFDPLDDEEEAAHPDLEAWITANNAHG